MVGTMLYRRKQTVAIAVPPGSRSPGPAPPRRAARWLTTGQAACIVFQIIFFLTVFAISWSLHLDGVMLLWKCKSPLDGSLGHTALACAAISIVGFAGASVLLNRTCRCGDLRRVWSGAAAIVLIIVFAAPSTAIIAIDPPILEIGKALA